MKYQVVETEAGSYVIRRVYWCFFIEFYSSVPGVIFDDSINLAFKFKSKESAVVVLNSILKQEELEKELELIRIKSNKLAKVVHTVKF